jgi:cytochrome c biogenesis protein CcmG/thiol:disulfide interchange protein DsbE
MTEAQRENRSKSRGISRYPLALIPLVPFCGIAATAAKMLYD